LDVSALLQFATQIVFVDTVQFGLFEISSVRERSAQIHESLSALGVQASFVKPHEFTISEFSSACHSAAEELASDLEWTPLTERPTAAPFLASAYPDQSTLDPRILDDLHRLIVGSMSEDEINAILKGTLQEKKAAGSDEYMLATSQPLRRTVNEIASASRWTRDDSRLFTVYSRYYLNQQMARRRGTIYAPSVARSRIVHQSIQTLLAGLTLELGRIALECEPVLLEVPSIADILVRRGRSDPIGIIEEAVSARESTASLRVHLSSWISEGDMNSHDWRSARKEIRELALAIRQDLGLIKAPTPLDAIELSGFGLTPKIRVGKLWEWIQYTITRRRITALSEFAKAMADTRVDKLAYPKLYYRCCNSPQSRH
jgi:hypothetical protein